VFVSGGWIRASYRGEPGEESAPDDFANGEGGGSKGSGGVVPVGGDLCGEMEGGGGEVEGWLGGEEGRGEGKVGGEGHEIVAATYGDDGDGCPGGMVAWVFKDGEEGAEDVGCEGAAGVEGDEEDGDGCA